MVDILLTTAAVLEATEFFMFFCAPLRAAFGIESPVTPFIIG